MSFLDVRDELNDQSDGETKSRPKTKETITQHGVISAPTGQTKNYEIYPRTDIDKAYTFVKKTPEALAMVNAIVEDVMGFGVDYKYVGRKDTPGVNNIQDAKTFWKKGFHMELEKALVDMLVGGRSYMYINQVARQRMKSKIQDIIHERYDFNDDSYYKAATGLAMKTIEDEDRVGFQGVQQVPASTIQHEIDEYGNITQFVQKIYGDGDVDIEMEPDNVIHMSHIPMNGETYGFTPIVSTISEMALLGNVKDYQSNFFKNAGVVNKLFTMEEEGPKSQNYKHLMKTMRKFRQSENQHKDMVITGNVDVQDLNSVDSEMDFRELSEYLTRVIIMAWGVPPSRIGIDVSGNNSARSASLNQQGYYKKIRRLQEKVATILNNELFEPLFGVRISFNNPDIKTEVRMADRDLRKTEVVKQMVSMGLWGSSKAMDYMDVEPADLPSDMDPTDIDEEQFRDVVYQLASNKNNMADAKTINRDTADEEAATDKRQSANNNQ